MTRRAYGSIKNLGNGRWLVRWQDGYDENGKPRRPSHVVRGTARDAELYLSAKAAEHGKRHQLPDMTIADYWHEYRRDIERLSVQTVRGYERVWSRHVEPLFGDCVMEDLTSRELRRRLLTIESAGAQRNALKLLRQMYNAAIADDLVENMPIKKHMRLDKVKQTETPTFTLEEAARFLDAIHGADIEALALVQMLGGLRREEAAGLSWSDFRFDSVPTLHGESKRAYIAIQRTAQLIDGAVVVGEPKTQRSRRTVLIVGVGAERLKEIAGHGWLNGGDALGNPETYGSRLATICRNAGLPHMTPTGLRATFSTLQQQLGTPDTLVSMMMGHSQLSTRYRHYLSANEDAMLQAGSALDAELFG